MIWNRIKDDFVPKVFQNIADEIHATNTLSLDLPPFRKFGNFFDAPSRTNEAFTSDRHIQTFLQSAYNF